MKQKVYMDVRIYDDNMRTIYTKQHAIAEKTIHEVDMIMRRKIKGI